MKVGIRLYKCHDMDLILLKSVYHVNLGETARLCLKAYVNHEFIFFDPLVSPDVDKKYIYKKYQMTEGAEQIQFPSQSFALNLNETEDADCVDFWYSIIKGYRTMFIKQLLRIYLRVPMLAEFMIKIPNGLNHFENQTIVHTYNIPLLNQKKRRKSTSATREEIEKRILIDKTLSSGNEKIRQELENKILQSGLKTSATESFILGKKMDPSAEEITVSKTEETHPFEHVKREAEDAFPYKNHIEAGSILEKNEDVLPKMENEPVDEEENEELMNLMSAWIG